MISRGPITWIAATAWLASLAPVLHSTPLAADEAGAPTQQEQYEQTAESASEGAMANKVTAGVWAGVAGVCTYACAAVGTSESVCTGAQVAGTASEAAATRDLQSTLSGIAGAGSSLASSLGGGAGQAATQGAQQGGQQAQRNIGACTSAATAALQTVTKVHSMRNAQGTAQASRDAAQSLDSFAPNTDLGAGNSGAQSQGASAGGMTSVGGSARGSGPCAGVNGSSSHASIIQCAMANDRRLPSFVASPRFANELQKKTGMTLPEMVNRVDNPTPLLAQTMGGALGGNSMGIAKLASSLKTLESGMASDQVGGSLYAGGGSGSGSAGASSDEVDLAAIGQMMSGMMQQMNPDQAKEDPYKSGVGAVIFANQHRSPASVAEDRALGIFDRVTYRYYYVGRRIVLGEGVK